VTAWTVRVTAVAKQDLARLTHWTLERFGAEQARAYAEPLKAALVALQEHGPRQPGLQAHPDLGADLYILYARRFGPRHRHLMVIRHPMTSKSLEILRILHEAQDPARHLPD
jgi:toxin ParE1/3/4